MISEIASSSKLTSRVSWFSFAISILLILCGFLAILLPVETSFSVVIIVSWLLIISAVMQFVHAFGAGVGHMFWKVACAVIYFVTGVYLHFNPKLAIAVLTLALIAFFVAQGLIDIFAYLRTRKSGASAWLLLDGVITLILGLMISRHWPSGSFFVISTLIGINMIMTGTTRLMLTLMIHRELRTTAQAA